MLAESPEIDESRVVSIDLPGIRASLIDVTSRATNAIAPREKKNARLKAARNDNT